MMPNKIILLTIFLYITLNLRKIENFIQNGYKIESFMADGSSSKADGRLAKQKQIIAAQTSEYQISGAIAIIKLFIILCYFLYYKVMWLPTGVEPGETSIINMRTAGVSFLVILIIALIGAIAAASASEDLSDDSWKTVTTLSTLSNEIGNLVMIYIAVQIGITGIDTNFDSDTIEQILRFFDQQKQAKLSPKNRQSAPSTKRAPDATSMA